MNSLSSDFHLLLGRIRSGDALSPQEIVPYLCSENLRDRGQVNRMLAEAYLDKGDYEQAGNFIRRAWVFSGFSEKLLRPYIKIHSALGDVASIQAAYKRLGMRKAEEGDISRALRYFTLSMYAYAHHVKQEKYDYDFDILEAIERMAGPYRLHPEPPAVSPSKRKVRIAYLAYLQMDGTSVFHRINQSFAKYHDKTRFEIAFFTPEPKSLFQNRNTIDFFREHECRLVTAPEITSAADRVFWIADQIHRYGPDLLVTNAGLADLHNYFVAALRPAPVMISAIYGAPPQYTSPLFDWGIAAAKHPLMDSPCSSSLVELELDLSEHANVQPCGKKVFGIPENGFVLMSAGRHPKFQDPRIWKAMGPIIQSHPQVYWVLIGVKEQQIPFLSEILTPELKARLRFMGWRKDYLSILGSANLVIDTFPSGGGFTLIDAMALGIPVVSFENNYVQQHDQADWSVGVEFIPEPELILERGNFEHFRLMVSKLIENDEYRNEMAGRCREQILLRRGRPERMVRKYEEVYDALVKSGNWRKAAVIPKGDFLDARGDLSSRLKTLLGFWMITKMRSSYELIDRLWHLAGRVKRRLLNTGASHKAGLKL
jgi:glycosyltransferase involved in cell wall biosynthesis